VHIHGVGVVTKAVGLAVLMLLGLGIETTLACSVPFIPTLANQTVDGVMTARSGKPCTIRFVRSPGPMYSADIVQRPSNGTVRVGSMNSIIYTSRAGFVGNDTFTYARRGLTSGGQPATRTIRIAVRVLP
jgi:Bacterial Ig domain